MSAGTTVSVPNTTVTKVLSRTSDAKAVWFRHASETAVFYVYPQQSGAAPVFTDDEFALPVATSTQSAFFILTADPTCDWDWYVYQASGGAVDLVVGRWDAPGLSSLPTPQ